MVVEPSPFEIYVNDELPKRPSTEDDAATLVAGKVPVSTGIGLGLTFVDPGMLLKIGLITERNLPIDSTGRVLLSQAPLGGLVLDMVMVQLLDDSYVEINGIEIEGRSFKFEAADYAAIKDIMASATVTYLGILDSM